MNCNNNMIYTPSGGEFEPAVSHSENGNMKIADRMHSRPLCSDTRLMQSSVAAATVGRRQTGLTSSSPQTAQTSENGISLTPETLSNTDFLPAYLTQYIGHWIRADFFIGTAIEQQVGILKEVGASYIILDAIEPATLIVCDIYSLKFVTIILDDDFTRLMRV